jgi:hypothetical protein
MSLEFIKQKLHSAFGTTPTSKQQEQAALYQQFQDYAKQMDSRGSPVITERGFPSEDVQRELVGFPARKKGILEQVGQIPSRVTDFISKKTVMNPVVEGQVLGLSGIADVVKSQPKRAIPTQIPSQTPISYPKPTITPYPSPTPIPGLGIPNKTEESDIFLDTVVIPMAERYGVHPAIAAGQFALEGRLAGIGAKRNNFFNIGNSDSKVAEALKTGDYSKLPKYDSPEAGTERYMDFITGNAEDSMYSNGIEQKKMFKRNWQKNRNNPELFLKNIGGIYASTGDEYYKSTMNTPEYKKYSK